MNPYKLAWMAEANMLRSFNSQSHPERHLYSGGISKSLTLGSAISKTVRAGAIAFALSQVDGPLPVMDVLAVSYFAVSSTFTWYDYFTD